ncbi:branched-chain amino acid ABC transporter permease [Bradyrhizobium sp. AS23.2]|uniref:branched-chain amino acid ABC transporter permease n=1 Tax=Bradyrhizobium sp. AS23.2 TaxID=1680155 RepID=UPI00093D1202|nr:branched-chain amino acid ABC transporter permease [Bradyrhizobium sp. AS23.2]OKO81312.1 ABC transporter permease [Bradyrhizobium sp. AS23.2]
MRPEFFGIIRSPFLWGVIVLFAVLGQWASPYHLGIATQTMLYIALALAWAIVGGFAGQLSIAHNVFVALGALLASALFLRLGINMWVGLVLCAALSALIGVFFAYLDSKFSLGHLSFALVTLAFGEVGMLIVAGWDFVGGASGLSLPRDQGRLLNFEFGGARGYFWAALALATVYLLINYAILHSRLGFYLRTLRDNEAAAQAVGVYPFRNKAIAMAISAAMTSVAGTLYARFSNFVDPSFLASPTLSIEIILIATIGGLTTPLGPAVAAIVLVPFSELLRGWLGGQLPGLSHIIYGFLIVAVILASPRGLVPLLVKIFRQRGGKDVATISMQKGA